MKAIILSGGKGTRLYPITEFYQKQLLPVYDKPMIYYALSIPMMIGIRDIAIITTPRASEPLHKLLGDGSFLGVSIEYFMQDDQDCLGIAYAILRCEKFIDGDDFILVLGDTVLYGAELVNYLEDAKKILIEKRNAVVLETFVSNISQFGSVMYDENFKPVDIVEKSITNNNTKAIPGVYFFTSEAFDYAKKIEKSWRGEYEITGVIKEYLNEKRLHIKGCGRGIIWIDTGTFDAIATASEFIALIQDNLGIIVACLEEISLCNGWIDEKRICERIVHYGKTRYGNYLKKINERIKGAK